MKLNFKIFCFFIFALCMVECYSQEPAKIKVKKDQKLVKIYFDNTDYKLIPIDRYGNPQENKVKSFKLWIKGKDQPFEGFNNSFTSEMIQTLGKLKKATKIFITEIQVEDDGGHLIKLPDVYEVWFPDCKNCDNKGRKK